MRYAILFILAIASMLVTGCTKTVYKEVPVTVRVPVTVPCVVSKPEDVKALKDLIGKEEWDKLSTDQRNNLVGAQALDRKTYGDRLNVSTAGCQETGN